MIDLIKKEFKLAVHPTMWIFLAFAAFVFIPNYPYEVMFFFSTLSIFFMCLSARENNDLFFTCTLPVSKANAAKARILTAAIFQILLVVLAAIMCAVKNGFLPAANLAGMDSNAVFIGTGLIILGIFNVTFFPRYYKDPNSVGVPFVISSIWIFLIIIIEIALCHAVPFVRDNLDTLSVEWLWLRVAFAAFGAAVYMILGFAAIKLSARRLSAVDL